MPNKGLKPRFFMHIREDLKQSESNSAPVISCSVFGYTHTQHAGGTGKDIRQVRGKNSTNVVLGLSNRRMSAALLISGVEYLTLKSPSHTR
jgi:polygalacturonase